MKETISYWKNGKLVTKKVKDVQQYVNKHGITQYYMWGYCFMKI